MVRSRKDIKQIRIKKVNEKTTKFKVRTPYVNPSTSQPPIHHLR